MSPEPPRRLYELPARIARGVWRGWLVGRLRREHSQSWADFLRDFNYRLAVSHWEWVIAARAEKESAGERVPPPPPHPWYDPGYPSSVPPWAERPKGMFAE